MIRPAQAKRVQRHAVNPSLGARLQHPCCKRSLNALRLRGPTAVVFNNSFFKKSAIGQTE
jgi:hypothetical protein